MKRVGLPNPFESGITPTMTIAVLPIKVVLVAPESVMGFNALPCRYCEQRGLGLLGSVTRLLERDLLMMRPS
jgi:hypothetical protein